MFKYALLLGLLAAPLSHAEPYIVAGIGKGELIHPGHNKWWIQEGWGYTIDQKSTVWNLGLGWKFNRYLATEVSYHDLGEYHHFAGFMMNEDIYNPSSPTLCTGPCEPTQFGYLQGSAKGWSLSLVPRLPITNDLSIFGRYGVVSVTAKFRAFITPTDPAARKFSEVNIFSERMWSEVYGYGITYKALSLERQAIPTLVAKRGGCCSAYTSGENYTISYRWTF